MRNETGLLFREPKLSKSNISQLFLVDYLFVYYFSISFNLAKWYNIVEITLRLINTSTQCSTGLQQRLKAVWGHEFLHTGLWRVWHPPPVGFFSYGERSSEKGIFFLNREGCPSITLTVPDPLLKVAFSEIGESFQCESLDMFTPWSTRFCLKMCLKTIRDGMARVQYLDLILTVIRLSSSLLLY